MTKEFIPAACEECSDTGVIHNKPCPYCGPNKRTGKELIGKYNQLIEEFMGQQNKLGSRFTIESYLYRGLYHASWDWLVPVIEKIEKTNHDNGHFYVQISTDWVYITKFNDYSGVVCKEMITFQQNKLSSTYMAVVRFIKWYSKVGWGI